MRKGIRVSVITICIWLLNSVTTMAQCAMCRAAVENNISEESASLSAGLNTGILYLFIAPYLMVTVIGLLWYWKSKANNAGTVQPKSHSRS